MKINKNSIIKTTKIVFKVLIVIILVSFIAMVYLQRFSKNKVSFFDFRMFTVVSESMKPKYVIGDVLFSKKVNSAKIKVGDSVTYLGESGELKDKIVTHQVIKIEKNETGEYLFYTKGINNLIQDPVVNENQIYGKVVYKAFILSLIYKIIMTNIGFYLCIIVPIMGIVGYELFTGLLEKEAKRRAK